MLNLYEIFFLIIFHWVADFLLQTDWQANNKSTDNNALLQHTATYSWSWAIPGCFYAILNPNYVQWSITFFILATFVLHTITDYFTSRITAKYYKEKKYRAFFRIIGIDQILHYVQIFLCYYLIFK